MRPERAVVLLAMATLPVTVAAVDDGVPAPPAGGTAAAARDLPVAKSPGGLPVAAENPPAAVAGKDPVEEPDCE